MLNEIETAVALEIVLAAKDENEFAAINNRLDPLAGRCPASLRKIGFFQISDLKSGQNWCIEVGSSSSGRNHDPGLASDQRQTHLN